jgi:hypothetical protein
VEVAEAILRGRPRGRFGNDGSGTGLVRGRPLGRLGTGGSETSDFRERFACLRATKGEGAILYSKSSLILQI